MATITIRNVPEAVHQALKDRAEKAGRSLNSELIQILMLEIARQPRDVEAILEDLRRFKATLPPLPEVSIEELKSWIDGGRM